MMTCGRPSSPVPSGTVKSISVSTSIGLRSPHSDAAKFACSVASTAASSADAVVAGPSSSSSHSASSSERAVPTLPDRCSTHAWKSVPSRVWRKGRSGSGRAMRATVPA